MNTNILSLMVENKAGVLTRIAGLISRRGFNIDSLSVCKTENDNLSRMTISLTTEEKLLTQLIRQLEKQIEVVKIAVVEADKSVLRELLLIKIETDYKILPQLSDIANIYKAKTIDITDKSIIFELVGRKNKLDSFVEIISPFGILEMSRSGVSALSRGFEVLNEQN